MIRPTDAFVLAYTKLRTHKVRTGVTVGVAGIMFGLILAMIFIVQGALDSVERFSKEGLADRSIVMVGNAYFGSFNAYEHTDDKDFISEIESLHSATVNKKEAAAKKYNIDYNAATEDPSPIVFDNKLKKKTIPEENIGNQFVLQAAANHDNKDKENEFDVNKYTKSYHSAKILSDYYQVVPSDGELVYMDGGKDASFEKRSDKYLDSENNFGISTNIADLNPTVINGSVTEPFIMDKNFDPQKGEIPVIVPYGAATKQLGLKELDKKATSQQKLDRLQEIRNRINEVKIDYCYRNTASQQLLSTAIEEAKRLKELKSNPTIDFISPPIEYKLPSDKSCGAVKVKQDRRSAEEKQQAENQIKYEKAIGVYVGEPEQRKITFRGVGIVGDISSGSEVQISDMVMSLLGSNLGWGSLPIPADLLEKVPEKYRPADLFSGGELNKIEHGSSAAARFTEEYYLVELANKNEARDMLQKLGNSMKASATQFGSNSLLVDEFKSLFTKILLWALLGIGGVAVIILGSMIGRTVSEGRRESAVFRAIGAKRIDIAGIYSCYAFLLSLRVVAFSLVLGGLVAFVADLLTNESATVGARLAYAARDTTAEFHIFSVLSWYVPLVIGVIIIAGVLASLIPIIRSVRRNPINDMRDE